MDAPLRAGSKQAASTRRDESDEFAIKNVRDPERRLAIRGNLNDDPIEGMMAFHGANCAAAPYRPQKRAGYTDSVPTLIVLGTDDEHSASSVLHRLTLYFPASLRRAVPGVRHSIHQDARCRVNHEIRSWLALLPVFRGAGHGD